MAWIDRLKAGLSKTRMGLTGSIAQILRGTNKLSDKDIELLEEALIAGDVGAHTAMLLVEELTAVISRNDTDPAQVLKTLVHDRLDGIEKSLSLRPNDQPTVFLVAGVNGSGKTTTIAKLATHLRAECPDLPITFAAADTFRAAAIEQLDIWAKRVGADFIRHQPGADPSAVVFDALDHAIRTGGALFIDTAGRLQTKHNLMEELKKIERTVAKKLGRDVPTPAGKHPEITRCGRILPWAVKGQTAFRMDWPAGTGRAGRTWKDIGAAWKGTGFAAEGGFHHRRG